MAPRSKDTPPPAPEVLEFPEIIAAFKEPLDPAVIKQRKGFTRQDGSAGMIDYVEWQTVADVLDKYFIGWELDCTMPTVIGDIAVTKARITIDGITRSGLGTGTASSEMGIKKSEHDALKRAAVKFGVARYLYHKESSYEEEAGSYDNQQGGYTGQFNGSPIAQGERDAASGKQLGAVRAIARNLNVDPDIECVAILGCDVNDLSKRAASFMIDHLKAIETGAAFPSASADMQNTGQATEQQPYVPPVTEQLPPGVTRGMPTHSGAAPVSGAPDNSPHAARSLGDMITAKQIGLINGIGREMQIDAQAFCQHHMGCGIEELGKRSASDLIERLQAAQQERPAAPVPGRTYNAEPPVRLPPAPPPQPASAAQGAMAKPEQIKAVKFYANKVGYKLADVVGEYTHGRTLIPEEMSVAEAGVAIEAMSAM